ncbi:DUF3159 domain-containing protein [Nakamurella sp. A5-74]|uniref:DUF3159 domain-containing protein n=1 Tax=Nakamurella sp. A5-74 TaxID=3158264 RepID=A0AAU8DK98_9ACTN
MSAPDGPGPAEARTDRLSAVPPQADPQHIAEPAGATAAAAGPPAEADSAARMPSAWEQMGGIGGMIDSAVPVIAFVIINAIAGLTPAIIGALAAGVLIAVIRLIRHEPISQAVGGLFGVGIAAFIAGRSGEAKGFFAFGIWMFVVYGVVLLISILIRWPLIGVIWENLNGRGNAWRQDRKMVRRYDCATALWVLVCVARFVVQRWLYDSDQVGWLAFTRIAMGYPLFVLVIIGTVLIVTAGSGKTLRQQWDEVKHKRATQPKSAPLTFKERYRIAAEQQERKAAAKQAEQGTD